MTEISLEVTVEVHPTEDPNKVKISLHSVLGSLELKEKCVEGKSLIIGKSNDLGVLTRFRSLLRSEGIRNAAKAVLLKGLKEDSIIFHLNKQVAYAGRISFSEPAGESPLGPIKVEITCGNPRSLIQWLVAKGKK